VCMASECKDQLELFDAFPLFSVNRTILLEKVCSIFVLRS